MSLRLTTLSLLFCVLGFVSIGQTVEAQVSGGGLLSFSVTPQYPSPNEQVSFVLSGFGLDLNQATVVWEENGVVVKQERGATHYRTETGEVGSVLSVTARVTTPSGEQYTRSKTIRPVNLSLVWEANTYTPPFYKGKALYTSGSELTVVAIPQFQSIVGGAIPPENLFFTWKVDGSVFVEGFGIESISVPLKDFNRQQTVGVTVQTEGGSITAEKKAVITPADPELIIYPVEPLLGPLYNTTADAYTLSSNEVTLLAVPFFFSVDSLQDPALSYSWSVNGRSVSQTEEMLSFGFEEEGSGTSRISVEAEHRNNLFQIAETLIQLNRN